MSIGLVLASASAARRRMLENAGLEFTVDPASVDESAVKKSLQSRKASIEAAAVELAVSKANEVAARHRGALVIGADQMLDLDGDWLNKPETLDGARRQLAALSSRVHRLISGVTVVCDGKALWTHVDVASLRMRYLSPAFIDGYLARMGNDALTSVGAYQLEGLGAQLFDRIDGDYFTILGLPLLPLLAFLRQRGAVPT